MHLTHFDKKTFQHPNIADKQLSKKNRTEMVTEANHNLLNKYYYRLQK